MSRPYLPLCIAIGALLCLTAPSAFSESDRPPNLVFIIADDCTFRDIGCYGGQAHTPNIDRLAAEGMRMTRCFQAAPMCSPTRHNIYTGLYPVKSGAYPNHTFVKAGVKSVVTHLKPLGYRVGLSGKRHIGPAEAFPFEYSGRKNPDMEALDRFFGECAGTDTPFAQFVCSNEPHSPWDKGDASRYPVEDIDLPPYLVDTPATRDGFGRYLAEITYFDGQVGRVLELLDKHQLADNTLVMVVSEQGNSFPFAKWTLYDHGLQSIMITRWPGRIEAGSVSDAMVEYVDVLPTFLEAAGGKPDPDFDGRSFLPVLLGQTDRHKDHVFAIQTSRGIVSGPNHYGIRSVRSRSHKLIHNLTPEARFQNAATNSDYFQEWKQKAAAGDERALELVERYVTRPEFELYDLRSDPLEQHNLADDPDQAPVMEDLKERLAAWMKSQGDLGQATELAARERMHRRGGSKGRKPRATSRVSPSPQNLEKKHGQ